MSEKEFEIDIVNLIDEPKYIEEVSTLIWKQWSSKHGATVEDIIYRTKHSLGKDRVPSMYIAKHKDALVGFVSLWTNDLVSRQDLYPWLSTLYVKEEYRNLGIGKRLQYKCIEEAKKLGYKHLYLTSYHENYYEKTGWNFMEKAPACDGRYKRIFVYDLEDEN